MGALHKSEGNKSWHHQKSKTRLRQAIQNCHSQIHPKRVLYCVIPKGRYTVSSQKGLEPCHPKRGLYHIILKGMFRQNSVSKWILMRSLHWISAKYQEYTTWMRDLAEILWRGEMNPTHYVLILSCGTLKKIYINIKIVYFHQKYDDLFLYNSSILITSTKMFNITMSSQKVYLLHQPKRAIYYISPIGPYIISAQ